mgnify:FL=1
MKYNIIRNKDKAGQLIGGTSRKDHLIGWSYKQLVQAFGEPTYSEVSGDGKVQKQWVFERVSDGACFTIYDWKTGDQNTTEEFTRQWTIGSKVGVGEFTLDILKQLKRKN